MPNDVQCLVASVKKKCSTEYNMMRKITVSKRKVAAIQKAVIESNSSRKKRNWLRVAKGQCKMSNRKTTPQYYQLPA